MILQPKRFLSIKGKFIDYSTCLGLPKSDIGSLIEKMINFMSKFKTLKTSSVKMFKAKDVSLKSSESLKRHKEIKKVNKMLQTTPRIDPEKLNLTFNV